MEASARASSGGAGGGIVGCGDDLMAETAEVILASGYGVTTVARTKLFQL